MHPVQMDPAIHLGVGTVSASYRAFGERETRGVFAAGRCALLAETKDHTENLLTNALARWASERLHSEPT